MIINFYVWLPYARNCTKWTVSNLILKTSPVRSVLFTVLTLRVAKLMLQEVSSVFQVHTARK